MTDAENLGAFDLAHIQLNKISSAVYVLNTSVGFPDDLNGDETEKFWEALNSVERGLTKLRVILEAWAERHPELMYED